MCQENRATELLEDGEVNAMAEAILYLDGADERQRERFMYHLNHRYFPEGEFSPKRMIFGTSGDLAEKLRS